jgi:Pyridoxamine 5'-phosphate oxidase
VGRQFSSIQSAHREFIQEQKIFFTASATGSSRVNLSPKDGAALRIVNDNAVVYLDQTGSGSETAAHLRADGRLTLMFCAFTGAPIILRLYGKGKSLVRGTSEYRKLLGDIFDNHERAGARQIIWLDVDLVQTSCGYGVPLFDYAADRPTLTRWAETKGEAGLAEYRQLKNSVSIDGLPTGLI